MLGVKEGKFKELQTKYFNRTDKLFNVYKLLSFLVKEGLLEQADLAEKRSAIDRVLKNIDEFLFDEADELLKELKKKDFTVILLSFGDLVWQKDKIRNTGIRKMFDKVIITDKDKRLAVQDYKKAREIIYIINDKYEECRALRGELAQSRVFLVKSPYSGNSGEFVEYNLKTIIQRIKECKP